MNRRRILAATHRARRSRRHARHGSIRAPDRPAQDADLLPDPRHQPRTPSTRRCTRAPSPKRPKHGIKLVFQGSPTAFSPPTQIPFLNAAIARKPDAILIAPTDKHGADRPDQEGDRGGHPGLHGRHLHLVPDRDLERLLRQRRRRQGSRQGAGAGGRQQGIRRRDQRGAGHQHDRPAQAGLRVRHQGVLRHQVPRHAVRQRRPDEGLAAGLGADHRPLRPRAASSR